MHARAVLSRAAPVCPRWAGNPNALNSGSARAIQIVLDAIQTIKRNVASQCCRYASVACFPKLGLELFRFGAW